MEWVKPEEIERRSMEAIEQEMPKGDWTLKERAVVKRCIHASADFDYAANLYFSPGAVEQALEALKQGASIVTDTNMAAAGINKRALGKLGGEVHCYMAHEDVAREAAQRGVTRALVSMERAAGLKGPVLFAIGNAPTALLRLEEMVREGAVAPALIIGAPVGFVNVVESKERICRLAVPCIVARGRKGGSSIAAAICNGLLYQAV
ncbi:MAG: precorrin-8X methylmutase [Lachnospiraceae bacterium]|nr:precorrin-8X methylmutase [Lachnospiraceae bacterium]